MTIINYSSFAGQRFLQLKEKDRLQIEKYLDLEYPDDILRTREMTARTFGLAIPKWPTPRLRINQLYWPVGASRCGVFRGVAETSAVESMLAVSGGNGTLRLYDEAHDVAIEARMWILPPRPIYEAEIPGLYLVTLVDRRWHFRRRRGSDVAPKLLSSGSRTWSNVWTDIVADAGAGFTTSHPTVAAEQFGPDPDSAMFTWNEPATVMLDSVAGNCGWFAVSSLSNYGPTQDILAESWRSARENLASRTPTRSRLIGGSIYGLTNSLRPNIPAEVQVVFPTWDSTAGRYPVRTPVVRRDGVTPTAVRVETVTPSSLGSPYSSLPSTTGTKTLFTSAKATYSNNSNALAGGTPTNATQVTDLARRLARDFYDAEQAGLDVVYLGLVQVDPRIGCDIIWELSERGAMTHLKRLPFDSGPEDFQHAFGLTTFSGPQGLTVSSTRLWYTGDFSNPDTEAFADPSPVTGPSSELRFMSRTPDRLAVTAPTISFAGRRPGDVSYVPFAYVAPRFQAENLLGSKNFAINNSATSVQQIGCRATNSLGAGFALNPFLFGSLISESRGIDSPHAISPLRMADVAPDRSSLGFTAGGQAIIGGMLNWYCSAVLPNGSPMPSSTDKLIGVWAVAFDGTNHLPESATLVATLGSFNDWRMYASCPLRLFTRNFPMLDTVNDNDQPNYDDIDLEIRLVITQEAPAGAVFDCWVTAQNWGDSQIWMIPAPFSDVGLTALPPPSPPPPE